jgi:hypothetical protein
VSGLCGNFPLDGNAHFLYICNDHSNGVPCVADSWAGTPVFGHRYRFRVQWGLTAINRWDYWLTDVTTGVTKKTWIASTWSDGWAAWWGGETHDNGSLMGSAHIGGNDVNMYWMQFYRPSVGAWTVVTDIDAGIDIKELGSQPSWYGYDIFNQNYTHDGVNIWTADH